MENLTTKQKIIFISLIIIMVITVGYYFIQKDTSQEFDMYSAVNNETEIQTKTNKIIVHVVGCVENEGIVELEEGARIADAIEASGGLTLDANLTNVNLAYPLQDGQKIKIPSNIEDIQEDTQILIDNVSNLKVNINTATQTELETLTGIGPSTALKIIEYRTKNGKFKNIEELKNVSGIGEAKYNSIQEDICV